MASTNLDALLDQTGRVHSLARRLVNDPNTADDLAQEGWVQALERRPDTGGPLRGWLATVLRNNLGRLRRGDANRLTRERRVSRAERDDASAEVLEKASTHKDVVLAVLALEEPYRGTVLMRYFEQLSYSEIARRMHVTKATVNSRITRGLAQLREKLEAEYGDRHALRMALAPLAFHPAGALAISSKTMILTTLAVSTAVTTLALGTGFAGGASRSSSASPESCRPRSTPARATSSSGATRASSTSTRAPGTSGWRSTAHRSGTLASTPARATSRSTSTRCRRAGP